MAAANRHLQPTIYPPQRKAASHGVSRWQRACHAPEIKHTIRIILYPFPIVECFTLKFPSQRLYVSIYLAFRCGHMIIFLLIQYSWKRCMSILDHVVPSSPSLSFAYWLIGCRGSKTLINGGTTHGVQVFLVCLFV